MALPVLCADWDQVEALVKVPRQHRDRLDQLWPGAITVILEARRPLPAAHADGSLAIRIPGLAPLRGLLAGVGSVTGTSANRHEEPPCSVASEALKSLIEKPDLVLDGGRTAGGEVSTIVDLRSGRPKVLRQGPIEWFDGC
jgi:tRNA threonylcarbamoyl adenosine modification protein (Sua5/YciO/YrdC/YwlC family)